MSTHSIGRPSLWRALSTILPLVALPAPNLVHAQTAQQAGIAAPSVAPRVTIAPYGLLSGHTYAGWPLILTASARHPDGLTASPNLKPILLASEAGHWAAACSLSVTDSSGKLSKWPLHAAMKASAKPMNLDGASAARTVLRAWSRAR